jgi:DNA-binding FadR family transcriptional regulator
VKSEWETLVDDERGTLKLEFNRRMAFLHLTLKQALEGMRAALESGTPAAEHDFAFHRAVAAASRNAIFADILESFRATMFGVMNVGLNITREGTRARQQRVIDEHVQIYEAILAGEPASAELAMRYHLDLSRRRLIDRTRNP